MLPKYILEAMTAVERRRADAAVKKVDTLQAKMEAVQKAATRALRANEKGAQRLVDAGFKAESEWFDSMEAAKGLQDTMRKKYAKK